MKKLFGALLALISSVALATTTVPVQLLNPTGSTSGQAIISTGASSAPAWGNVSASGLAAQAANTVLANATGASASPTAFAMPSCTTALEWVSGTGFTCNSAGAFTTLSASGLISPTSSIGIKGTATNDNAQAGSIGEYPTPTNLTTVSLTTATAANVSSVPLAAGDYEISGVAQFNPAGTTVLTAQVLGVSTTSATLPALPNYSQLTSGNTVQAGIGSVVVSPTVRISLASTTTVYLVAEGVFTTSTCTASGWMHIRRVR